MVVMSRISTLFAIIISIHFIVLMPSCASAVKRPIIHTICLNLINPIALNDKNFVIKEIKKLNSIKEIIHLEISEFIDVDDPRTIKECQLMVSVKFKNKRDLQRYQENDIHRQVIKSTSLFMVSPPMIFDTQQIK